jgi:outer membrane protein TolC
MARQTYFLKLIESYLDYELTLENKNVLNRLLLENQKTLEQANDLVQMGLKTKMDVLDSEIQVTNAQRDLNEHAVKIKNYKKNLLTLLNEETEQEWEHMDFLKDQPYYIKKFEKLFPNFLLKWKNEYLLNLKEIQILKNNIQSSRIDLRQSQLSLIPRIDIALSDQWDYTRKVDHKYQGRDRVRLKSRSFSINFSWTIWDWWITPNSVKSQSDQLSISNLELSKGIKNYEKDLEQLIEEYHLNTMQINSLHLIMKKSELHHNHALERYKLGRITMMELQRAMNQKSESKILYITSLKEKYILTAKLLYYMGIDLDPQNDFF